jgi:hypothetical protein
MLRNGKMWIMTAVAGIALLGWTAGAKANQITLQVWEDSGARTSYTITDNTNGPGQYDFGGGFTAIAPTADFTGITGFLVATNENAVGVSQIAIDLNLSTRRVLLTTGTHTLHVLAVDNNFIVPGVQSTGTDTFQGKGAPSQPASNTSTFGAGGGLLTLTSSSTADSTGNLGVTTTTGTFTPPPGAFTLQDQLALTMGPGQRNVAPAESTTAANIVPEPASMVMVLGAFAGMGFGAWVRRRRS